MNWDAVGALGQVVGALMTAILSSCRWPRKHNEQKNRCLVMVADGSDFD